MINQHEKDLNKCGVYDTGDYYPKEYMQNNNIYGEEGVHVYFRDIKKHLIHHIQSSDYVFGAVAWMTDFNIMHSLSSKEVAIVVQKEDFLRPDINAKYYNHWKKEIRYHYDNLSNRFNRYCFHDNIISHLSVCSDPTIEAVRCVGNFNKDKVPAFPRMHNKFLIFADKQAGGYDSYESESEDDQPLFHLKGVWTGSFNLTYNATMSLENAVYMTEPTIINAYYREFGQIVALSEPLDWDSIWSTPEWRIGT